MLRSAWILPPVLLWSSLTFAWGERGHDAVTRVAARLVANDADPEVARFGTLLQKKENMLAHLANVPDIVWRNMGKDIDDLSSPSHYIDLEYILDDDRRLPKPADFPQDFPNFEKAIGKNCDKKRKACSPGKDIDEKVQKVGHAPFRVEQLAGLLKERLSQLKALEKSGSAEEKTATLDEALLYAGILSHFIGDLANPHHTTKNYDGWEKDQGGLHGYFETEVVDSLGLDLEAQVLDEAERHRPMKDFAALPGQYLKMAWTLVTESHQHLDELEKLDERFSLLSKSDSSNKKKAERKKASDVRERYRNFIILRLAVGADALSRIWIDAWKGAGQPDLAFYRSYNYPVKPDFLPLTYKKPGKK